MHKDAEKRSSATYQRHLIKDNASLQILRGAFVGIAGRGIYFAIQYFCHILVARLLGSAGYGLLQLGVSIGVLIAMLSRMGIPRVALKYIPSYRASKDADRLRGLLKWVLTSLPLVSIFATTTLIASGSSIASEIFQKPDLTLVIVVIALSIPFCNSVMGMGSVGVAYGSVSLEVIGEQIVQPSVYLFSIFILVFLAKFDHYVNASQVGLVYSASWAIAAVVIAPRFINLIQSDLQAPVSPIKETTKWMSFAAPMIASDFIYRLRGWFDLLVAGALMPSDLIGIYAASVRIAYLPGVVLEGFNRIFAHRISALHSQGSIADLKKSYSDITFTVLTFSLPAVVLLALLGSSFMSLFGPSFEKGNVAMVILLSGQLTSTAAGPSEYLLMMTGNERKLFVFTASSALFNLIASLILIPRLGLIGAAIANSASLFLLNLAQLISIVIQLKIHPYSAIFFSLIPPSIIAGEVTLLFAKSFSTTSLITQIPITCVVFMITYFLIAIPFGVWRNGIIGEVRARRTANQEG